MSFDAGSQNLDCNECLARTGWFLDSNADELQKAAVTAQYKQN
jgi:hypothetical protein